MNQSLCSLSGDLAYSLSSWEVLLVNGEDASKFLQGQVSCDIHATSTKNAQLGACINLKGRVISNFIVYKVSECSFQLLCPLNSLELTQTTLKKYAVFSKVTIEQAPFYKVYALSNQFDHTLENSFTIEALNCQFVCIDHHSTDKVPFEINPEGEGPFLAFCITSGLCLINKSLSEKFTAQEINLELVKGVNFTKGCYTGQEVVARLHYRGVPKRRAFIVRLSDIPQVGEVITDENEKAQGEVLNSVKSDGAIYALVSLTIEARELFPEQTLHTQVGKVQVQSIENPPYSLVAK